MDRKDVLNSPEYWTSKTQIELYNQAQKFMKATGKDRAHLAEYLGVSKGYVSQLNYSMVITTTACQSSSNWH